MAEEAPTPIWLRPAGSPRGRPALRGRRDITLAAVAVGDRGGLADVTMRSVANELGTSAGSLYRHVQRRSELIDLMVDHVAGEYVLDSPSGDWARDLADHVRQALAIHRRHPWLAEVVESPVVGPQGLQVVEHVLAVLAGHPSSDGQKLVAMAVMNALVTAFARQDRGAGRGAEQARYLAEAVSPVTHPRIAALTASSEQASDADLPEIVVAALRGLLS